MANAMSRFLNITAANAAALNSTAKSLVSSVVLDATDLPLDPVNATTVSFNSSEANNTAYNVGNNEMTAEIICYALIAVFFSFFIAVVLVDMRRKYITGELKEDLQAIPNLFCSLVMGIPKLVAKLTSKDTWYWFTRLFKREKKIAKDLESAPERNPESMAIINRLAAKPAGSEDDKAVGEVTVKVNADKVTAEQASAITVVAPIEQAVQTGEELSEEPKGSSSKASSLYSLDLNIDSSMIA